MIKLGQKVKDYITGFEGIATSRTEYMYGCARITVEGVIKDEKEAIFYFDEQRLQVIEDKSIQNFAPKVKTGGDAKVPPSRKAAPRA